MNKVRSRRFIKQFYTFALADQGHLSKAIKRILQDPTHSSSKEERRFSKGRPVPGYTVNRDGTIVLDNSIVALLKSYREQIEYRNAAGVKVLMHLLRRDYGFYINHKKIYRLCRENGILLPKNKKKLKVNRRISQNRKINKPNMLWQFDIKTGYVHGENKHFYFLAIIDVFNKEIKNYHLGYNCKSKDLKFAVEQAIAIHKPNISELTLRSDNGPQMTSNQFFEYVSSIHLEHEFIPVRTPNKNAFIESFFSIYETQFLQVRYFNNFKDVYKQTNEFVEFYNNERLHGCFCCQLFRRSASS